jgi:hypothetical protein
VFDSKLNLQGVAVRVGYMLSDAVGFNLNWAYAWRVDDALGTGGLGDININPMDQYQIFQADLTLNSSALSFNQAQVDKAKREQPSSKR